MAFFSSISILLILVAKINASKVLIVTGNPREECAKSEVINLDNEFETCQDFPDFPSKIERATGGLFFDSPLICGGAFYNHQSANECFIYNKYGDKWYSFGNLSKNRTFAASVMHLYEFHVHAILITGGFDENENYLDSSVHIGKPDLPVGGDVHVWSGPKLPNPISAHTMVRISELNADYGWVDSMIIGGWAPEMGATEDTHFLIYVDNDPYNMEWVEGPKLNVARSQHASGIVTDSETGETIVVTAGGLDDGDSLDSTEILIDNKWIFGPSLPKRIFGSSIVPYGKDLVLIGGYSYDDEFQDGFYKFSCSSRNCVWTEMPQKLAVARENFVAIPIPDDLAICEQ